MSHELVSPIGRILLNKALEVRKPFLLVSRSDRHHAST